MQLLKIPVKEVESTCIFPYEGQFVEDVPRKGFFFDLLGHIPLHEIMGGVVFSAETKVDHFVDARGHRRFVLE